MQPRVPVTFTSAGETVWVEPGITVAEAAQRAGVLLAAPCAGRGVCAGCGVRVIAGELEPADDVEARTLRRAPAGVRLACRARVKGAVDVRPLFALEQCRDGTTSGGTVREGLPEAAAASGRPVGGIVVGVDLGTTSVAALIVDAGRGREVARATVANSQQSLGADVLARVSASQAGKSEILQHMAEGSVTRAIREAARMGDVAVDACVRVVIAGNSAMTALLAGANVSSLAAHPFSPPVGGGPLPDGSRRVLGAGTSAEVLLVPPIAAFVGGDALAATLAVGLVDTDVPRLLVDIGTNAEIVLARTGSLLVTSAAAGPAFEGVGVSCGGPATAGAVDRVRIVGEAVELRTIGDVDAGWFSGAGLVSAVAELRRAGYLAADGLFVAQGPLAQRFRRDDGGVLGVTLSAEGAEHELRLTQLDVRALQLAKAAVRVGVESLLRHADLASDDLAEVLVAGAFGAALDPDDLAELGVLPSAPLSRTRRVGNAALDGAAAMALDPHLLELAASVAGGAQHVDLAAQEAFGGAFLAATEFAPYEG